MNQINQNKIIVIAAIVIICSVVGTQQSISATNIKDYLSSPPSNGDGYFMACYGIKDHSYDYALGFTTTPYFKHQFELFQKGYDTALKYCAKYNKHTGHYEYNHWIDGAYDIDGKKFNNNHHYYKNYSEMGKALEKALYEYNADAIERTAGASTNKTAILVPDSPY